MAKLKVSMSLLLTVLLVVSVFAMGCPPPRVVPPVVEPVVIEPPPPPVRYGAWVDEVIVTLVVDTAKAVAMLAAGELDVFAGAIIKPPALIEKIRVHPEIGSEVAYGLFWELSFNPVGPIFPGTGKLNPFVVREIREAMNWLVDRTYIVDEFMGGMGIPRWTALHPAFPDYARLLEHVRPIELYYAHDPAKAKKIITEEMLKLGAELIGGFWYYKGERVEIITLSRVEDERLHIGRHVAGLMRDLGFVVTELEKTAAEATPIWLHGDPAAGLFHIYTGGWVATTIDRDQGDVFDFFYTTRGGWATPLWLALKPDPELDEIALRLFKGDFADLDERADMMAQALWLSLKDSPRIFLANRAPVIPRRHDVRLVADLAGGISGAFLWGKTARFVDPVTGEPIEGGTLRIGLPSLLTAPWNPVAGSAWVFDIMFTARGLADLGAQWDPFTGLRHPSRIERAEVYVKEGLPVGITHDWLTLEFVPEIKVPDDAWVDWDATAQRFITLAEAKLRPDFDPERLTAKVRVRVHYPEDFWDVKWHDGSTMSMADIVMGMILGFDRAKKDSPIFDPAAVPAYTGFMAHFRGVQIISEDPLIIESYTNMHFPDAEWLGGGWTWYPTYPHGPAPWHKIALGVFPETAGELAFSAAKAGRLKIEQMSYIAGPTIPTLAKHLGKARAEGLFPYKPTLGQFLTPAEVAERWSNIQAWYDERGHFWVSSGVLQLVRAYPVEKIIHLERFPYFPDPADRWLGFTAPKLAEVDIAGPAVVRIGKEAVFDIEVVDPADKPYPVADIEAVTFLLRDAVGKIVYVGRAVAVKDGLWQVVLTPEMTAKLILGPSTLEIAVAPIPVALPTFGAFGFIALP